MNQLTDYSTVQTNIFVRIEVPEYKDTPNSAPRQEILRFSDLITPLDIDNETYLGVGNLMGITDSWSELRPTSGELIITLSGIPNSSILEITSSKIKGCAVRIYRAFLDPTTGLLLPLTINPILRYRGFVNNFSLQETYEIEERSATNTIVLTCASAIDVLVNKYTGRKTNPSSQRRHFPGDKSMDRVPNLENATFDFGAPRQ